MKDGKWDRKKVKLLPCLGHVGLNTQPPLLVLTWSSLPFAFLVAVHGDRTEWENTGNSWPRQNRKRGGHPNAVLWNEGKRFQDTCGMFSLKQYWKRWLGMEEAEGFVVCGSLEPLI